MRAFEAEGMEKAGKNTFIDINVLANRGHDALSHVGMAREICALENKKLKYKFAKLQFKKGSTFSFSGKPENFSRLNLSVKIEHTMVCSRYIGAVMENVEIKESPKWIKDLLKQYNINPINNVVDATNYVMLETGQPLHAFDFDKIKSELGIKNYELRKIIVRRAKNKEKIKLLDGQEKELTKDDLVIADSGKALAIAGIKGGVDAGITEKTETIILESANFDAASIRRSRMRLGLKTDASDRFEKGLDPNLAETAMARLIEILENSGGKVADVADVYPKKIKPWKIKLNTNYVNRLLGESIPKAKIVKILKSLELGIKNYELSDILVEIPTFRIDLKTQEDLIEEIGRTYGYENIKPRIPHMPLVPAKVNEERIFERAVKNILAGAGFSEVYDYSFYSRRDAGLAQLGTIKHLELENPMNPEQELLRVSLIPNILKNVRENLKNSGEFNIFEIGRVYWSDKNVLPEEKNMLAGAIIIKTQEHKSIKTKKAEEFYEAKGCINLILNRLGITDHFYDNFNASPVDTFVTLWHGGRSAEIKIEGTSKVIGYIGEINPLILTEFDIHKRVAMFEFDMKKLREVSESEREYEPIRKYPTVTRDISMVAKEDVRVDDILRVIQKTGGNLVLDADLFDIFDFEDNTSSYAFHIIFGADNRTLKSEEVDVLMEKIINNLEKGLRVKVRK